MSTETSVPTPTATSSSFYLFTSFSSFGKGIMEGRLDQVARKFPSVVSQPCTS